MVCVLGNAARGRIKVREYTECISHEFLLLEALLMIVFAHVHVVRDNIIMFDVRLRRFCGLVK